jgi:hypothetical protein
MTYSCASRPGTAAGVRPTSSAQPFGVTENPSETIWK